MAVDTRTKRVTPRQTLGVALNQSQDVLRAFEDLQADVILLANLLEAAQAALAAQEARIAALEGP